MQKLRENSMQNRYIKQLNISLSPLGFGVMRLPINPDRTFPLEVYNLLIEAYERGINYFDTAYPYLFGHSEVLIRDTLVAKFPRDSFYIADKLPVWECSDRSDMERIFNIQLERLGVEYIDFYLLHGLHRSRWLDIHNKGVLDFLEEKRREGRIRKVGFSFHDTPNELTPILDAYGWDFAQLQINYYDWTSQHAKDSYDILVKRDIPCLVMEPVGGGRLAKLPVKAESILKKIRPGDSIASWAVRFTAGLPNVATTLSGMVNREQLLDNLSIVTPIVPLSTSEQSALEHVVNIISESSAIPCTGCGYCLEDCPNEVDIPQIFQRYNNYIQFENMARFDIDYFAFIPKHRRASNCIACGKCEEQCPQKIDIAQQLEMIHNFTIGLMLGIDTVMLKESLADGSQLVCFGTGAIGRNALPILRECECEVDYFCDNAEKLWGTEIDGITVLSPAQLQDLSYKNKLQIIITSSYNDEIKAQLNSMGISVDIATK